MRPCSLSLIHIYASAELADARAEYNDKKAGADRQFAEAEQQLADAQAQLDSAKAQLDAGEAELEMCIRDSIKGGIAKTSRESTKSDIISGGKVTFDANASSANALKDMSLIVTAVSYTHLRGTP